MDIRKYILPILAIIISIAGYGFIGYELHREHFIQLFISYSVLFLCFIWFYKYYQHHFNFIQILGLAILFRFIFVFSIPVLSNDFYRFLWDGHLIRLGINPFLYTPEQIIDTLSFPLADKLYQGMGALSQSNYTCYPSLHQFIFFLASIISPNSIFGSIVVLHIFMLLAAIGNIYFIHELLIRWNLPKVNLVLFALNPFIIIELTGNLHFEGIMIFFLIWAMYLLSKSKHLIAGIVFGLSASIKLIPFIFIPILFRKLGARRWLIFCIITGITFLVLFIPFFNKEMINNFFTSLDLYFQKFEFNASIYYIIRAIGYHIKGYNIIHTAGIILGITAFVSVLIITVFTKKTSGYHIFKPMMFTLTIYYFLSTTVHPWYITTVVALSLFTSYRFTIIWGYVLILSYFAYRIPAFDENLWLVSLEYTIIYSVLVWEVFKNRVKPLKST